MRAESWRFHAHGEPRDVLHREWVDVPRPEPGQLRVHVRAAPANFADLLLCQGRYFTRPLLCTPGIEACGVVESVGEGVVGLEAGTEVIGLCALPFGGFADAAIMRAERAFVAPDDVEARDASALFGTALTSLTALRDVAHLRPGEVLLVHGASGGVGNAAIQVGRKLGALVVAVASGAARAGACAALGADVVVDRTTDDFVSVVRDLTAGRGADVALDPVGGPVLDRTVGCMARGGRIVLVGLAGGSVAHLHLSEVLRLDIRVRGLYLGSFTERESVERGLHLLGDWVRDGSLRLGGSTLDPDHVAIGLQAMADGDVIGRLVFQESSCR